jgi:hypothetical protein
LPEQKKQNVTFKMLSYEEARMEDPRTSSWMLLAENAALSTHGFICEDGPELPKEKGQEAARDGGEILEWMYDPGCISFEQARIQPGSEKDGAGDGKGNSGGEAGKRAQERVPTPVPSGDNEDEMTYGQARLVESSGRAGGRVQRWQWGQRISRRRMGDSMLISSLYG